MKIVYIDMDDTICKYTEALELAKKKNPNQTYPQSQWGFFIGLQPIDGAIDAINRLKEKYDVWILTRPSSKNLNCYSEKAYWVANNLGEKMVDKLIISPDKSLSIGDYLIDDNIWSGFKGEQLLFGSDKFKNWDLVLEYLMRD